VGVLCCYHDELASGVVVDYLDRNNCQAQVAGWAGVGPDPGVRVLVPGELLHRVKWLWAQADLTEAELGYFDSFATRYLATSIICFIPPADWVEIRYFPLMTRLGVPSM